MKSYINSAEFESSHQKIIALAGNPNVGKSTLFNQLTGMKQHTGNWPGKTVTNAQGLFTTEKNSFLLVDLPGTYSLLAHSSEEEIARNYICFDSPDCVIVVCDATCLERNLNLLLQTMEITSNVILCVNLMDEAKKKQIQIDLNQLSELLGIPVVGLTARKKKTLCNLIAVLDDIPAVFSQSPSSTLHISYPKPVEKAISMVSEAIPPSIAAPGSMISRWLSIKLLDQDVSLTTEIQNLFGEDILKGCSIDVSLDNAHSYLNSQKIDSEQLSQTIVSTIVSKAEDLCRQVITFNASEYNKVDRRLDQILTSKLLGYPVMLALLAIIFWITITGANYPSALLSQGFSQIENQLTHLFNWLNAPSWLHGILVLGIFRVVGWVVSVMLPPMAIFFPLFALLEDSGYLPRVAFNLDKPFRCCNACGKQALTMCMGFGCNAAAIVGCRIIDSPRERLLAILTNNFVPCNGRFPSLIAIISMFFIGSAGGFFSSFYSSLLLTLTILLGILATFLITKTLSMTLLQGVPSSFTLELPPYRRPQFFKVIIRSLVDRALFVLGRAVVVAAPAGMIIWLMANATIGNSSLLNYCADLLDPFANIMGLDGVILIAFILGFPANEIVIPIIIMAYMAQGSLTESGSLIQMKDLFVENGWTSLTAICTMIFFLMHWPCSTTLLTIKKESGSLKWAGVAAVLPTITGIIICIIITTTARIFL